MNVERGFSVTDLQGMLRRRAGIVITAGAVGLLLSLPLAALLPNTYASYATVLVEPQRVSEKLVEGGLEVTDLNTRLDLMSMQILSRPRLSRIIDDLDLYGEESEAMTREAVIEMMRSNITVEPVEAELAQERTSRDVPINTFRIIFRSANANTAAAVTNRLANDFIEEHIRERVEISGETSEFIEAELARLGARIQEVETRIAQIKGENPGKLPDDLGYNQRLLERTLQSITSAQRELDVARSDEAFYRQQSLNAGTSGSGDPTSPARRLEQLEVQLGSLKAQGYTDKHPDVLSARTEIEGLRARLAQEAESAEDGTAREDDPLNLAQQNAEAERRRAELRIASIQEEIQRLQGLLEEVQQRIAETPRVAERLDSLQREYEHLTASYRDFSNRRLAAGVAANMERRQKGEQFRVLESAFPASEPSSPNRPMIILLGLTLGLGLGAALAVLLEGMDSSFHGARPLQGSMRIPVLTSIPSILFDSDRAARRRRRVRQVAAVAVVSLVVVIGSGAGYWWVNVADGGTAEEEGAAPEAPGAAQEDATG